MRLAIVTLLAAGVLLAGPMGAWAADEPAHGDEPSLFAGTLWNAIWALLIFAILLGVLGRFAFKPVAKVLEEREKKVHDTIAEAERGRDEAMDLLAQYKTQLEQAQAEAQKLIDQARAEAAVLRQQIVERANSEADQARQRAVQQIETSRDEAVAAVFTEAASLATRAAGQILQRELRPEDHQRLVEQTLAQMAEQRSRN